MKKKKSTRGMRTAPQQPQNIQLENWIDLVDAAQYLKVGARTLARWRKERGLPFAKIGRKIYFHTTVINDFLAMQMQVIKK